MHGKMCHEEVSGMDVRIEYLSDSPHFAGDIAKWIYDEFIAGIKHGISYEQVLSSMKNCHKAALPVRFVAVMDGKCVGAVSLVENDLRCRNDTPWLAALYVDERHRKNKIGERLIERVKDAARDMGYKELFLRTEHASGYYRKLGWQFVESCDDDFNLKPDVFKVGLDC